MDKLKIKRHWFILFIVSLMNMGALGLVNNTIGVYYVPVAEDLNILTGTFSMNATIAAIFVAIGSLFAPRMLEHFGWKKTITLGGILSAVGIFGMGLTKQVAIFNILGAIRGLGVAFSSNIPAAAILNNWFKDKIGLAISIATASTGVVSVIFSPIFQRLIETIGWQNTFFVHGMIIVLLFIPAIFIPYEYRPEDENLLPYGAKKPSSKLDIKEPLRAPVKVKDYIGGTFFMLVMTAFLQTFAVGMGQHLPGFGASIGASPEVIALLLSAVMIGNVSSKMIAGYLSDQIGTVKSVVLFTLITIVSLSLLMTWTSNTGLLISSLLFGTAYAGGVLHVLMTKEFYGVRIANYVNGPLVFMASTASAIGNVAIGYFYDFTGTYMPIFLILIVLQIIALMTLFIAQKYAVKEPKELEKDIILAEAPENI